MLAGGPDGGGGSSGPPDSRWFVKTETFKTSLSFPEIKPHLDAHKVWVAGMRDEGKAITSGYRVDAEGKPGGGGLMLFAAPDHAAAEELVLRDPLVANHCVDWQLNEWIADVGDISLVDGGAWYAKGAANATSAGSDAGPWPLQWYVKTETFKTSLSFPEIRPHLEAHKAWVAGLRGEGKAITSGYRVDADGKPGGGGLMLFMASSHEAAIKRMLRDPLIANHCVDWQLNQWIADVGDIALVDGGAWYAKDAAATGAQPA